MRNVGSILKQHAEGPPLREGGRGGEGRSELARSFLLVRIAASMDQVKEFGRLAAYSNTTPLSLFNQTRVGRACFMVSRWRDSVVRARSELDSEGSQASPVNNEIIMPNGVGVRAQTDGPRIVNDKDTTKSKSKCPPLCSADDKIQR